MDPRTPWLLQFNQRGDRACRMADAQLTFRQPLGRGLGCWYLRSNGLRLHSQQSHLIMVTDEFIPLVNCIRCETCLRRQYNRKLLEYLPRDP